MAKLILSHEEHEAAVKMMEELSKQADSIPFDRNEINDTFTEDGHVIVELVSAGDCVFLCNMVTKNAGMYMRVLNGVKKIVRAVGELFEHAKQDIDAIKADIQLYQNFVRLNHGSSNADSGKETPPENQTPQ